MVYQPGVAITSVDSRKGQQWMLVRFKSRVSYVQEQDKERTQQGSIYQWFCCEGLCSSMDHVV